MLNHEQNEPLCSFGSESTRKRYDLNITESLILAQNERWRRA
jgi:hypothetical protein